MAKSKVSKNSIFSAFKLALLLTLVLATIWFIYNYLQTGSFSLRPSAKGGDCTTSAQCGTGYLCKAGVCVMNPKYECFTNYNCKNSKGGSICNKGSHKCVQCLNNRDCGGGKVCTSSNKCVAGPACPMVNTQVKTRSYANSCNFDRFCPDLLYIETSVDLIPGVDCEACNWNTGTIDDPNRCLINEAFANESHCVPLTDANRGLCVKYPY